MILVNFYISFDERNSLQIFSYIKLSLKHIHSLFNILTIFNILIIM